MKSVPAVLEAAAVAVPEDGGGPDRLVLFAVLRNEAEDLTAVQLACQAAIRSNINPLFKLHQVCHTFAYTRHMAQGRLGCCYNNCLSAGHCLRLFAQDGLQQGDAPRASHSADDEAKALSGIHSATLAERILANARGLSAERNLAM